MNKYQSEPSSFSQQTAKANRERLFSQPAAAVEEEAKKATAVRQNMARLRELRLAKEAQEIRTKISTGDQLTKPKSKKRNSL